MKKAYYYLYYKIFRIWSRDYHPLISNDFRANISIMALEIWAIIAFYAYLSLLIGRKIKLAIGEPTIFIPLGLIFVSNFFFLTFSNGKTYFEEFKIWPPKKNLIGGIIVWSFVIFIFVNLIISVELMKKKFG